MIFRIALLILFLVSLSYIIYNILKLISGVDQVALRQTIFDLDQKMVHNLDHIFIGKKDRQKTGLFFTRYNKMLKESHFRWIGITNIYTLTLSAGGLAYITFNITSSFFNQEIAGMLCAAWMFTIPYEILKMDISNERRKIRKHLPHFILNVLQVEMLTSDIQETFRHLVGTIKKPLNGHIAALVRDIDFNVEPEEAFRRVKEKTSMELLLRFYDYAFRSLKEGTKLKEKLEELAEDAYDEQLAYESRITENVGGFTSIGIVLIFGFMLLRGVNSIKPDSFYILTHDPFGQLAVNAGIILTFVAVKMMRAAIAYKD